MSTLDILRLEGFSPEIDHVARLINLADQDETEAQEALAFLLATSSNSFIQTYKDQLQDYADSYGGTDAEAALARRRQFGRLANGSETVTSILSKAEPDTDHKQMIREILAVACSFLSGRTADPYVSRDRARQVVDELDGYLRQVEQVTEEKLKRAA